jgi:hypothetical protein
MYLFILIFSFIKYKITKSTEREVLINLNITFARSKESIGHRAWSMAENGHRKRVARLWA